MAIIAEVERFKVARKKVLKCSQNKALYDHRTQLRVCLCVSLCTCFVKLRVNISNLLKRHILALRFQFTSALIATGHWGQRIETKYLPHWS